MGRLGRRGRGLSVGGRLASRLFVVGRVVSLLFGGACLGACRRRRDCCLLVLSRCFAHCRVESARQKPSARPASSRHLRLSTRYPLLRSAMLNRCLPPTSPVSRFDFPLARRPPPLFSDDASRPSTTTATRPSACFDRLRFSASPPLSRRPRCPLLLPSSADLALQQRSTLQNVSRPPRWGIRCLLPCRPRLRRAGGSAVVASRFPLSFSLIVRRSLRRRDRTAGKLCLAHAFTGLHDRRCRLTEAADIVRPRRRRLDATSVASA